MSDCKVVYRTEFGHTGYWIKDALGVLVFFVTHDKKVAQLKCDELYGEGKYKVNSKGGK